MKFLIVVLSLVTISIAQRPFYAGNSPKGRPDLASRFKDPNETESGTITNRINENASTMKIPIAARGDYDLVNRLRQWPRENQPFWLLNADVIEATQLQQNLQRTNGQVASRANFDRAQNTGFAQPVQARPSFLSTRN